MFMHYTSSWKGLSQMMLMAQEGEKRRLSVLSHPGGGPWRRRAYHASAGMPVG